MKTKNVTEKNMKVCLVGSSGGHLTHLYMLKPFWKDMAIFLSGARIRYFNYLTYEKMNQEKPKERSA